MILLNSTVQAQKPAFAANQNASSLAFAKCHSAAFDPVICQEEARLKILRRLRSLLRMNRRAHPRPEWLSDNTFVIDGLKFFCTTTDYTVKTTEQRIVLLKPRTFIDGYLDLIERIQPKNVLEFGIWQGGSAMFLAAAGGLDRLVGIELHPPSEVLNRILGRHPVGNRIGLHFNTSQDDTKAVRSIIKREFGSKPLDIIVDDASHLYHQTKAAFEASFGYLRPHGVYVIEDWGWAHWPDWQRADHQWHDEDALTNLLFDLTMVIGANNHLISKIEVVGGAMVIITRGPGLPYGEKLDLSKLAVARGRRLNRI